MSIDKKFIPSNLKQKNRSLFIASSMLLRLSKWISAFGMKVFLKNLILHKKLSNFVECYHARLIYFKLLSFNVYFNIRWAENFKIFSCIFGKMCTSRLLECFFLRLYSTCALLSYTWAFAQCRVHLFSLLSLYSDRTLSHELNKNSILCTILKLICDLEQNLHYPRSCHNLFVFIWNAAKNRV